MPELPEVHTTVTGLTKTVVGLFIDDVWTDYNSPYFKGSNTIKDPEYFEYFKKEILGKKITSVSRRAKNILIHLKSIDGKKSNPTILIHMKMTGHVMIGRYLFNNKKAAGAKSHWLPSPDESAALHDPYNRFIHFVISLSNGKKLVLSDTRKFAKVTLVDDTTTNDLGPEPLDKAFTYTLFKNQLHKKMTGKIKTVLMDQSIISGIGNIYSDEALWRACIHPSENVENISDQSLKKLYKETIHVLKKGIDFGGDSMSDYRNIHGERGSFQTKHQVYRKTGQKCEMRVGSKICSGIIQRKKIGGRSSHFCPMHQKPVMQI